MEFNRTAIKYLWGDKPISLQQVKLYFDVGPLGSAFFDGLKERLAS